MPIALEAPVMLGDRDPTSRAIREAPAFGRTATMSRWHVLRSGYEYHGRHIYSPWCGAGSLQTGDTRGPSAILVDEVTDGAPVCGTCIGRAYGAGHNVGGIAVGHAGGLLFAPRGVIRRPDTCPSPGYQPDDDRHLRGTCRACGFHGRVRGGARGYSWTPLYLETHAPTALVDPCPFHLWNRIGPDGVCRCGHESWELVTPEKETA